MARRISNYVSYKEVVHSATAIKRDIDNTPNEEQLQRIILLANKLFDPLRVWCGGRVKINSVFRSKRLNELIGGSRTSQHMANKGAAIDIDDNYRHKTNLEMFNYIKDNLEFDQLIYEFGDYNNPAWLHVSYNEGNNRGRVMIATKRNGRTKYLLYNDNKHLVKQLD